MTELEKEAENFIIKRYELDKCYRVDTEETRQYMSIDVHNDYEEEYQCYLAGAKAHSVKWHKKGEPPTGPINRLLLGCVKYYNSKKYMLVCWNGEWWYNANTYNTEVNLIAWCELPKFYKE